MKRNNYDVINEYMKHKNERIKKVEWEYERDFCDYRDIDYEEKEEYVSIKLGDLPINRKLGQFDSSDLLWAFFVCSLYLSATSDWKSTDPKI